LPPEVAAAGAAPGPVAPAPPEIAQPAAPAPDATTAPGTATPPADPSTAAAPAASPFEAARPAINAALSQGELSRAHLLLSEWYNDPALLPTEQSEVQTLLNQLAGTVIYSNEHRLEPAYSVQTGETLETVAEKHNVPWQLLAKINGIASATAIQPGQSIKVIRGPFMGVVDVSDAELTLTIDGRYAGKYAVALDGAATSEGEWTVEQKQLVPATTPTAAIDRKLVLRNADNPSATVVIATSPPAGPTSPQGTIRIANEQAEDLYDILSIGSRVVIRR
jgi:LysM repeat protein